MHAKNKAIIIHIARCKPHLKLSLSKSLTAFVYKNVLISLPYIALPSVPVPGKERPAATILPDDVPAII